MQALSIRVLRPWMGLLMIAGCCFANLTFAQESQSLTDFTGEGIFDMPDLSGDNDIEVTATHMSADNKTKISTLDGNVKLVFGEITVTCDHATYQSDTGDVHAEGNVYAVSTSGSSWAGDELDFNHRTGEGLVGSSILKSGVFTFKADSAARDDDGILYARNATLTTCANDEEHWHWSVSGEGRYKEREFMELRNGTGSLFGLPILWMPYYYRDLNTRYGWRFTPGYTSKWGAYLQTGYVYPLSGSDESDHLVYGKNLLDFRAEYGVGIGQELTWREDGGLFGEGTHHQGRVSFYYAYHKEDQELEDMNWQSSYDENRWSFGLRERIDFSPRDFIFIAGEKVSDSQFRHDYDEVRVRASSQPLGIINYEHRENTWVSSLALAGPVDSFYAGTRRLPEFRLDFLPRNNVFGIEQLHYESQNSVGLFERQPAKYDGALSNRYRWQPGDWAYYDTMRLDTRHVFRRPFTLSDGVTLTPRAGWRGTYYGDSPSGSLFRSLFEIGMMLQARYWRNYDEYRHTVLPYVDFTFVPGSAYNNREQPFAFDFRDQEYEWRDRYRSDGLTPTHRYTGMRFGTKQFLHKRTKEGDLENVLSGDIYGVYVFQTQDQWKRWDHRDQPGRENYSAHARRMKEPTGLRVLGANVSYRPIRNLDIYSDFQFDPEETELALWDINLRYTVDSLILYAGYLRRNHEVYDFYWSDRVRDAIFYAGFIHHLSDIYDWSLYVRYNTEEADLEEIGGFIQYSLDCIAFRLNFGYFPAYSSEDGYKHEADYRISLGAHLTAFPKEEDEDWMDWGNIDHRQMIAPSE